MYPPQFAFLCFVHHYMPLSRCFPPSSLISGALSLVMQDSPGKLWSKREAQVRLCQRRLASAAGDNAEPAWVAGPQLPKTSSSRLSGFLLPIYILLKSITNDVISRLCQTLGNHSANDLPYLIWAPVIEKKLFLTNPFKMWMFWNEKGSKAVVREKESRKREKNRREKCKWSVCK